jgi:hypothetical protein
MLILGDYKGVSGLTWLGFLGFLFGWDSFGLLDLGI